MDITDILDELESWLWHHYPDAYQQGVITLEGYHSEDKTRLAVRRSIDFDKQFQVICDRYNSESEVIRISERYNLKK